MRVLVCGSREWDDEIVVGTVLNGILQDAEYDYEDLVVIDGAARGADSAAAAWYGGAEDGVHAIHENVTHERFPADWKAHGKAAGPIRNQRMLVEGKPDVVWAFKDDFNWASVESGCAIGGTEGMVRLAKAAGVPTFVVSRA